MKRLLTILLLCWTLDGWSQPILRNNFTTNAAGYSLLVWTNNASVVRVIGFPENDTNNHVTFDLSTPGTARTTLNAGTDSVGRVKWENSQNASGVGDVFGDSTFSAVTADDDWVASFSIGTNTSASTESLQLVLSKGSRGSLTVLNPGAESTEDEDSVYLFDTIFAHTNPNDVLLQVRNSSTNKFGVDRNGDVSLGGRTNKIGDNNTTLTYNGAPITGSETAPIINNYSSNNFFINGKGNTLVITQSVTFQFVKTNLLATDANGLVTTTKFGAGISWDPATQTISSTATGDTTTTNIVTLTQTGTNISAMDFSLVARGGVFKLALTNNAFMPTPSGVANTSFSKAWLAVQQPSTGTCALTFTNGTFATPEGSTLVIDTNNGAVTWYEMVSDVFTNGLVNIWMSTKMQKLP